MATGQKKCNFSCCNSNSSFLRHCHDESLDLSWLLRSINGFLFVASKDAIFSFNPFFFFSSLECLDDKRINQIFLVYPQFLVLVKLLWLVGIIWNYITNNCHSYFNFLFPVFETLHLDLRYSLRILVI